ncbi:iron-containing redox enzyme family protein [Burkholderia pseudomallei]|uniref:iron-containing redox enzyme family protein n=1 Tax=Burkholderia pseudomallei TaxID=28450 RepID=UPI0012AEDD9C|nr:iron-containing redox enzyme family protein [Burkholderia pseudomallei]
MSVQAKLLSLYDSFPFHRHPLWNAVLSGQFSLKQVVAAEIQHCIRTAAGQKLRAAAVSEAQAVSPTIFAAVLDTYLEECTGHDGMPSHLDMIKALVLAAGGTEQDIRDTRPTPGNAAAMALYRDIGQRGAACHILGAGAVEHYYSALCPRIYQAYTGRYGMSSDAAQTYLIHGPMDQEHAARALLIADEAVEIHGWPVVEQCVSDAFVATSLHYDGMYQAATGRNVFWDGVSE